MTARLSRPAGEGGAALIELMVSSMVVMLTGVIIFYMLNTGMVLFAKNTAINMAHQQARVAVLQMEQDLHSAISIPQLVDANRTPVSGNGPAAGISFQLFAAGPFLVTPNPSGPLYGYAAGQNQITIRVGSYVPKVGQRLCVPTHQLEFDIIAVGNAGTDRVITLSNPLPNAVRTALYDPGTNTNVNVSVTCFFTDRVAFLVSNGELRYFGRSNDNTYRMMANDITTPQPFSIPLTPAGAQFNRFVAAINLNTADDRSSNRGFKAANMFLNAMVPYRTRMCTTQ